VKKLSGFSNHLIVIAFNSSFASGCDYANHTLAILSQSNIVYGFCLGDPLGWRDVLSLFRRKAKLIEKIDAFTLFKPFFLIPGQRYKIVQELNYLLNSVALKIYLQQQHSTRQRYLWYFEPFHLPGILKIFQNYTSIYDCVDYFPAFSDYARDCHRKVLKLSKYVFVNSHVLYRQLQKYRRDTVLVPLGFAENIFKQSTKEVKSSKKLKSFTVGFIGGISARIDFKFLYEVACQLPNITFVLIGKVEPHVFGERDTLTDEIEQLRTLPNVSFRECVSKLAIPQVLSSFDVGIIPYNTKNIFNRYCFPMKSMEYFYMGLPVVTTNITELRRFQDVLFLAENAKQTIKHLQELQQRPFSSKKKRLQKQIAIQNSWKQKLKAITTHLLTVTPQLNPATLHSD